jgi:hypothetical protein
MIYLGKLPTLEKRVRVALDWAVDLFFPRDIARVHVPADARPGNSEVAGAAPSRPERGNLAPVA